MCPKWHMLCIRRGSSDSGHTTLTAEKEPPVESGRLAAGRLVSCEAADARADEPNILVIMSDDVGVDNVSELQRE